MNEHSLELIVSNINKTYEKEKIYVSLNYKIEDNQKYIYLLFSSLRWHKNFYIPLGVYEFNKFNRNAIFNNLDIGINLNQIFKDKKISIYNFLFNYNQTENQKEDFALSFSKLLYVLLNIPFEKSMKILNWIYGYNYKKPKNILIYTFNPKLY